MELEFQQFLFCSVSQEELQYVIAWIGLPHGSGSNQYGVNSGRSKKGEGGNWGVLLPVWHMQVVYRY